MKYLIFLLSLSALSAVAAVGKMKSQSRKSFLSCRDNDYYCQSKINETSTNRKQNEENSLNQFDSAMVQDVTKTLGQGLSTTTKK